MVKLGQHFLIDKNIIKKIVSKENFSEEDTVLEIGPGKGALTEELLKIVKKLFVVEIDKKLTILLKNKLDSCKNITIINADFLKFDFNTINLTKDKKLKIVGNIPYNITSPIIEKIFNYDRWESIILMVQKEVGERILSSPGEKSYSRLTLLTNFYSKPFWLCDVSKNCFFPVPEVDSMVIKFLPNEEFKNIKFKSELFKIISVAFSQRRKIILNSLSSGLKLSKSCVEKVIIDSGINPDRRPEDISLVEFIKLAENLSKFIKNPQNF